MTRTENINELLKDIDKLLMKEPFYRTVTISRPSMNGSKLVFGQKARVSLPTIYRETIDQSQYLKELNEMSHDVVTDDNIPSVCVKSNNGTYIEVRDVRIPLPYQKILRDKHVLHLCAKPMKFTQLDINPDEEMENDFITFKQYWLERNMEGIKTKMVSAQESVGDVGVLFYYNDKEEIKARVLKYPDYTIITHKDENGEHILECLYYSSNGAEYIDCYDDTCRYRITNNEVSRNKYGATKNGWAYEPAIPHGFSECPLITKRGAVAWDNVQTVIEMFETLYNIFYVIQKRHGWGILYIKGKFKDSGKRIAGNVILNDTSLGTDSDAKVLSPATPEGILQTLDSLFNEIMIGAGATILLPKDIKTNGDISGVAIQLTQSRDIETALAGVAEWQNVANKMCRLFKEGLSKELVKKGDEMAYTRFKDKLHISAKFDIWRPYSETEYNNMLISLKQAGLISQQTGVEYNTVSMPDEISRIDKETEENDELLLKQQNGENTITEGDKNE